MTHEEEEEEDENKIGSIPILKSSRPEAGVEHRAPPGPVWNTPEPIQLLYTPSSEFRGPKYEPLETPRSRRELGTTRPEPPVTRSRARIQTQDLPGRTGQLECKEGKLRFICK